ncbi:MAG: hypothetical protein HDR88_01215 [Bacteroides sp.]|nr:hypothetical protein [Bacteroides sp.]
MKIYNILATLVLATCTVTGHANEVEYSYANLEGEFIAYGNPKADNYDVAVKMTNLGFSNASVKGIKVMFPESSDISECKAWLSTELKIENNKNVANLTTVDAIVKDGYLTATFPDGFVIPEEGIFVGYSFSVTQYNDETRGPVILGNGNNPDGFYMHTSRKYYDWVNMYDRTSLVSAMQIVLSGDFPNNNGTISLDTDLNFTVSQDEFEIPLTFTNFGSLPIESMEFSYSFNGTDTYTSTSTFDPALQLQFTGTIPLTVYIDNKAEAGKNDFEISLSKINGEEVSNSEATIKALLYAFANVPKRRVLVEEYTGLWCGYCPRGYAAMEYMATNYPDDYVGISYHSNDAMETVPYTDYPWFVTAFPVSTIDRQEQGDPFYWNDFSGFGFLTAWEKQLQKFTPASIDLSQVEFNAESNKVTLAADVSFIKQPENDCRIFYILTANGLSDNSWIQTNYLSGESFDSYGIEEIREFIEGPAAIPGLIFNDIPVKWSELNGIEGSLPEASAIVADKIYNNSIEFDLNNASSAQGLDMIGKASSIRAIAGVVDCVTGEVLNCAVAMVSDITGVTVIDETEPDIVYYDLNGIRINQVTNPGIYLRRIGNKTEKIFIK